MGRHVSFDILVGGCVGKHLQRHKNPIRVFNFSGFCVLLSLLHCEKAGEFDSILSGAAASAYWG